MDTNEIVKRIQTALNKRHGSSHWTVKHGNGTAYGWLHIAAAPRFRTWGYRRKEGPGWNEMEAYDTGSPGYHMSPEDCAALAKLLGKEAVSSQGESVPASSTYYEEYIARAEGRTPEKLGTPYWD